MSHRVRVLQLLRGTTLTRAYRVGLLDGYHQHAAVAEYARTSVIDNRPNDVVDEVVGGNHLEHAHREKPLVLDAAKVADRSRALAAPADVAHGDAGNTKTLECESGVRHCIGTHDALHQFHGSLGLATTRLTASPRSRLRQPHSSA